MNECALKHLGGCSRGWLDLHHIVPKQVLKRAFRYGGIWRDGELLPLGRTPVEGMKPEVTLDELLKDRRNLVACCRHHHSQLEARRVYLDPPESAIAFAEEIGLAHILEKQAREGGLRVVLAAPIDGTAGVDIEEGEDG